MNPETEKAIAELRKAASLVATELLTTQDQLAKLIDVNREFATRLAALEARLN